MKKTKKQLKKTYTKYKKFLNPIIIFCIVIILFSLSSKSNYISDWNEIMVIEKTKKVNLNDFVNSYKDWNFKKIYVIDWRKLKWFIQISGLNKWYSNFSFMSIKKTLDKKYYNVYETNKPISLSLVDLWFSLTWETIIDTKFNEKSFFEWLLMDVWPLLLVLLLVMISMKFMLPKWWSSIFSSLSKIWKQSDKKIVNTKFSDIAWMDEVKNELTEIVDYLKNPKKYQKVWARHPKWVLLYWPPGSWKTLLARAVAWESNVPFFSASWSEFMEMLVWMWAAKVRELFWKAKSVWTAIIFIDEIDAIGKKRWSWFTWWHQEQEQTLNQILTEMDWFDKTANIIVIAATNRPDTLDPALLRAWRFDRKIIVPAPTYEERILIFNYYLKDKTVTKTVDIESLAKRTIWLVWADIENIVNETALKVAKENRQKLDIDDFEYALEKVIMWPEKKIKSLKDDEKNIIAFHELWHAICMNNIENADPVEKISIVRRWSALWVTRSIPNEDKYLYSKSKFLSEVVCLLWWRASEEVFFWKDNITSWALNDFEKATKIIKDMLTKYWMDEDLWPVLYYDSDKEWYEMFKPFSEETARIIDEKIKKYLIDCYKKSVNIIIKNKKLITTLSTVLLEKEYLTKKEFLDIINNPKIAKNILDEEKKRKDKLLKQKKNKK